MHTLERPPIRGSHRMLEKRGLHDKAAASKGTTPREGESTSLATGRS